MPPVRSQKTQEAKIRWACPFEGCQKTVSKKPDMRRHYRTHFNWIPFQCPYYATCKFQSQQESNVAVHIAQTKMHPEISADQLIEAKPVRVLPESSAPQLPPGWDQSSAVSVTPRTANPRRLPATVRRTVAESDAPAGSLDNFRILSFARSSRAKSPSPPRPAVSNETHFALSDLTESESSDEEHSDGPSTPNPSLGASPLVYHMTTEQLQLPFDFSSKVQLGGPCMKADSLTWTWDQLTAANVAEHTEMIFTDTTTTLDFNLNPLFENYNYDLFGKVKRATEVVPGFETTADLSGWNLDDETFSLGTMAGSGLSIPDDVYYNPAPSPKFGDFFNIDQDSSSPVIPASPAETFSFSPVDYFMHSPGADSLNEFSLDSIDSSSWNQLPSINWEEVLQITGIPLTASSC